jgi:phage regulator Rha-like protein
MEQKKDLMENIKFVINKEGILYTTSEIIADKCDIGRKAVQNLCEKYNEELIEMSQHKIDELKFIMQTKEITRNIDSDGSFAPRISNTTGKMTAKNNGWGGNRNKTVISFKEYYLDEQQATFLITLLKNSEVVVKFKKSLVKEFYRMKAFLKQSVEVQKALMEVINISLRDLNQKDYVVVNKQANSYINKKYKTKGLTKETMNEEQLEEREAILLEIIKAKILKEKGIIEHTAPLIKSLFNID